MSFSGHQRLIKRRLPQGSQVPSISSIHDISNIELAHAMHTYAMCQVLDTYTSISLSVPLLKSNSNSMHTCPVLSLLCSMPSTMAPSFFPPKLPDGPLKSGVSTNVTALAKRRQAYAKSLQVVVAGGCWAVTYHKVQYCSIAYQEQCDK